MFSWLISPSKALAEGMEIAFAIGLFFTTLMVVVGLVGEYKEGAWWKRHVHFFEMLVVLGVAGEMITETGAFWYSLRLQALEELAIVGAQQTASNSMIEAGKLGVTVDNLHHFVTQKETEADNQFKALKEYVATEDAQNASVVAELKKDKESLDKARNDAVASVAAAKNMLSTVTAELSQVRTPRSLTNTSELVSALKPFKDTEYTFSSVFADEESINLLRQFDTILQSAGWKRVKPGRAFPAINVFGSEVDFSVASALTTGIQISVNSPESLAVLQARPNETLPAFIRAAITLDLGITKNLLPPQEKNGGPKVNVESGDSTVIRISVGKKP
jgi:hypothetical protein